jgi:hypothetical protein
VSVAQIARRWALLIVCAVVAISAVVVSMSAPAPAAPTDAEGGNPALASALDRASRGYTEARAKLTASRARQTELQKRQRIAEQRVAELGKGATTVASEAYRGSNLGALNAGLTSTSVGDYLAKSAFLDQLSHRNSEALAALSKARAALADEKRRIDTEVTLQQAQESLMAKRKADAERALNSSRGNGSPETLSGSAPRAARGAPRRADGTFAPQGCTIDDPTSSGCLTPRALNALQQAKAAGFTHFVACFRGASFGEHPKGRACDFAAAKTTFGGVATGAEKDYGNRLAAYFIANSDRLGVLYVIWFRRIWLPGIGWRAYTRGVGTPSSDHTNHVHLSVQ